MQGDCQPETPEPDRGLGAVRARTVCVGRRAQVVRFSASGYPGPSCRPRRLWRVVQPVVAGAGMRPSCWAAAAGGSSGWSRRLPSRKRSTRLSWQSPKTGQFDLRFGLPLGWYWCQRSMAAVHQVFGLGLRDARRQRRLLSRAGVASGW